MNKKIGIIDLGSNSVRLVIFEVTQNGAFKLIDDISDTIRLSENMIDGKYLNDFAMRRALKTIKLFRKLCLSHNIPLKSIIAVATAAMRKAENREQFIKQLYNATGLSFRVLSGEEEALYVYKAVVSSIDVDSGIIVDIGGGSTEIIKFNRGTLKNYTSIPIGAVVATETYLEKDLIRPESLKLLEERLESILGGYDWLTEGDDHILIGLGGTIRNMSKIHRRRCGYPLDIAHNYSIDIGDFNEIFDQLKSLNLEARKSIDGMSSDRADIIVGGLAILKSIIRLAGIKELLVSGSGLREGIMYEHILTAYRNRTFDSVLDFSLNNYMDIFNVQRAHADHVCYLSLELYDRLKPLHGLGAAERKMLKAAALLHDTGISISYYDHCQHSYYLILNSRLNGLTHRETVLIATIAASHGKDKLKKNIYKSYEKILLPGDTKLILKLSAILRLAECLDRSETGVVKAIDCQASGDIIRLKTLCEGDAELEINLANENSQVFKKLFKKQLVVL
ncbi:MAG: Ppx/GppA family phosphatase [Clostridia bacterium]|nr:Ppx/GppA family phosphatase [Clostridia bacterium]